MSFLAASLTAAAQTTWQFTFAETSQDTSTLTLTGQEGDENDFVMFGENQKTPSIITVKEDDMYGAKFTTVTLMRPGKQHLVFYARKVGKVYIPDTESGVKYEDKFFFLRKL